ncbi:superoxide dismutase [Rickettsiales bacterium LUAb2]
MFKLDQLPYSYDALSPYMSSETLEYHHDKHHQAYIDFVNKFVSENPSFTGKSLEELIIISAKDKSLTGLFNNAAQTFNHNEFWLSLKNNKDGAIPGKLQEKIIADFGSVEQFKQEFIKKGTTLFGSGWVWLSLIDGKLSLLQYQNAGNPLPDNHPVILGCDVWEHSYYIDYRNKRADYLKEFINNLINWEYVESKFNAALAK